MSCSNPCKPGGHLSGRAIDRGEFFLSARAARSAVCILVLACAAPASAQSVARFSLESVAAIDEFGGENVSHRPQIVIDVSMARLRRKIDDPFPVKLLHTVRGVGFVLRREPG